MKALEVRKLSPQEKRDLLLEMKKEQGTQQDLAIDLKEDIERPVLSLSERIRLMKEGKPKETPKKKMREILNNLEVGEQLTEIEDKSRAIDKLVNTKLENGTKLLHSLEESTCKLAPDQVQTSKWKKDEAS